MSAESNLKNVQALGAVQAQLGSLGNVAFSSENPPKEVVVTIDKPEVNRALQPLLRAFASDNPDQRAEALLYTMTGGDKTPDVQLTMQGNQARLAFALTPENLEKMTPALLGEMKNGLDAYVTLATPVLAQNRADPAAAVLAAVSSGDVDKIMTALRPTGAIDPTMRCRPVQHRPTGQGCSR